MLVSQPLIAFHKALELFHKHAEKGYHEDAVIKYDEFLQVMSNQKLTINNQLSQAMTDRIAGGGRYLCLAQRKYFIVNYKRLQF